MAANDEGIPMTAVERIIQEAESLPIEQRIAVVEALLLTINPPKQEYEEEWKAVARIRLEGIRSGRVQTIPGDEVWARVQEHLKR
jgi:putative addiction module component (TIGR02574 family)